VRHDGHETLSAHPSRLSWAANRNPKASDNIRCNCYVWTAFLLADSHPQPLQVTIRRSTDLMLSTVGLDHKASFVGELLVQSIVFGQKILMFSFEKFSGLWFPLITSSIFISLPRTSIKHFGRGRANALFIV
jgi:hypothetical protein